MEVTPTTSATAERSAEVRVPTQVLEQRDFLKLLAAQMSSQDPLNPQTDNQFIAQMAQFSALEQSKTMREDMALLQANGLLGRTVELQVSPELTLTGMVSAVQIDAGTPKLMVDGEAFDLKQIVTVTPGLEPTINSTP